MEERLEPGLAVTFESTESTATPDKPAPKDTRRSRLIALNVSAGTAPSAYVPAGPFKATWRGNINLRIRGDYVFSAEGNGALTVTVNEEVVLDANGPDLTATGAGMPAKLKKGRNTIVAEYASPSEGGDASVRLLWSEKNQPADPVSPLLLTFDVSDTAFREKARERAGRELFAASRCLKCHTPENPAISPDHAMAELAMDAPSLEGVGARLNVAWLAKWIADPKSLRADASMPKVFHEQAEEKARDIAAFLETLKGGENASDENTAVMDEALAGAGGRLFTGLGCINCHVPPGQEVTAAPTTAPAFVKVPLRLVNAKYKPTALRAFLKKPDAHYAWIRMPDFKLTDPEADQLVAFLTSRAPKDAIPADAANGGDAERGKTLFTTSGCLNCHTGPVELKNAAQPPVLAKLMAADWTKGCVATDAAARGTAPDFSLNDDHRASLSAFAASDWASLHRDNATEFSERQVAILNCIACHTIDKQADTWTTAAAEISAYEATLSPMTVDEKQEAEHLAPDQSRPLLTWIGEKLRPEWSEKFIAGNVDYKPRSWLKARMPAFPARARGLSQGLAQQHGFPPKSVEPPAPDPELTEIGRKLSGKNGGFSCNQCHAIASAPALAAFEAPAPNFTHIRERLIKPFYDRWMRNPQRVQPGTRMPQFADGDGKSSLSVTYGGDAGKQFDALWQYLLSGDEIQPPE